MGKGASLFLCQVSDGTGTPFPLQTKVIDLPSLPFSVGSISTEGGTIKRKRKKFLINRNF